MKPSPRPRHRLDDTADPPAPPGEPVDVPERPDGWCEDRPPGELTDDDGRE